MGVLIMGRASATAEQMRRYIKSRNPSVEPSVLDMIPLYLEEGESEGVKGDIAFAQSCLETGDFTFAGSAVSLKQNNFCGMGVTATGMKGNNFPSPRLGIRAQVQHLKAYACDQPLKQGCVDPRFHFVKRGMAEYVEWLGIQENPNHTGWAAGKGYGEKILKIHRDILNVESEEEGMRINVHAGHNFKVPGASGIFSETSEDRKVKDLVIRKLQAAGHTVYDCTDESSGTVNGNLAAIVANCNAHAVDLDVSIHFNCYNGQAHGTEVFIYNWGSAAESYAQRIADRIGELGYTKRGGGVKTNPSLYVLRHTVSPALLIECCFCDNTNDAAKYTAERMANAIVSGITGSAMSGNTPSGDTKDWLSRGDTGTAVTAWQKILNTFGSGVNVDGDFGPDTEAQTIRVQRLVGVNPDGCVGEKTKSAVSAYLKKNNWIQVRDGRWWYRHADGGYVKNDWEKIGGVWFFFDGSGWMKTGWIEWKKNWYYLKANGAMAADELVRTGGKVYYVDKSGKMCYTDKTGALR